MKTWKIIFIKGFAWTIISAAILAIVNQGFRPSIIFGALLGGLIGALFGWWEIKWMKALAVKLAATIPDLEMHKDEKILFKVEAGHLRGLESVGGKLFVTDKRIFFRSHKLNIQNHEQEFPITEIKAVNEDKYEFNLMLKNSEVHRFRVVSPSEWVRAIPQVKIELK